MIWKQTFMLWTEPVGIGNRSSGRSKSTGTSWAKPSLKGRVHLIGSSGQDGSYPWRPACRLFLQQYIPQAAIIPYYRCRGFRGSRFGTGCDPTNYWSGERTRYPGRRDHHRRDGRAKNYEQISQWPSLTLNSKVTFQYVQTTDDPKVIAYDVVSSRLPGCSRANSVTDGTAL